MTPPKRHLRSYGDDPLPSGSEALDQPFSAFPSWFLRIECDRCGKVQMVNESDSEWRDHAPRDILARMRHDGFGGRAGKVVLLTGHRGREQPAGTEDRAAWRLMTLGRQATEHEIGQYQEHDQDDQDQNPPPSVAHPPLPLPYGHNAPAR